MIDMRSFNKERRKINSQIKTRRILEGNYWDNYCKLMFIGILQDLFKANDELKKEQEKK